MHFRSIAIDVLLVSLMISTLTCPAFANAENDLISELKVLDVFHPPDAGNYYRADLYNEWHYFNMIDEEQDIAVVMSLKLNGNVSDPDAFPMSSSAQVLLGYDIAGIPNNKYNIYSPTLQADFSAGETDIMIASSMVDLTAEGYHVFVESADGRAVYDALFRPVACSSFMNCTNMAEMIDMNWLVASPMMLVNGTLTINEGSTGPIVFTFEDAKGYHDHNWGYWNWANLRWDWGQVTQRTDPEDSDDKYTVSFGNVTSVSGIQMGRVMNVWRNDTIVSTFNELSVLSLSTGEFDTSLIKPDLAPEIAALLPSSLCYPKKMIVQASDVSGDTVNILFETEQPIPLPVITVDSSGNITLLIIWELMGTYQVDAVSDGIPVSFTAKGFMEDAGLVEFYTPPETTVDIEKIPIVMGSGEHQYNFAILSDLQYDTDDMVSVLALHDSIDEVIALNNNGIASDDVEFVVVLGDLIQGRNTAAGNWKGENEYRQEYEHVIAELERLKQPRPAGAGIDYIPVIGNHDVWFKFNGYSTDGSWPDYPEELYSYYFQPQYSSLSSEMAGWEKQEVMPSVNPYDARYPAPEFQNFAFDHGPYHFIFLDFCARDDFDPYDESSFPPTIRKFDGCADLHDMDDSGNTIADGTWQWIDEHLSECSEKGIRNVVVFTHHPPVYELDTMYGSAAFLNTGGLPMMSSSSTEIDGELHVVNDPTVLLHGMTLSNFMTGSFYIDWDSRIIADGTAIDRVEGDPLLAFNKKEYDGKDEYDRLASIFDEHGINVVHWFSGHYHLKGLQWYDCDIGQVSLVPSVVPADDIYSIQFDGDVMVNEKPGAMVTPQINSNGSIAIVMVRAEQEYVPTASPVITAVVVGMFMVLFLRRKK